MRSRLVASSSSNCPSSDRRSTANPMSTPSSSAAHVGFGTNDISPSTIAGSSRLERVDPVS
ncbi:Uncharacterised protein [Mycobacteroides abscessus subsp. abscessus]|nr:Uncharacterised protein [Mycobacteroides abscessus subsp. abscessus]